MEKRHKRKFGQWNHQVGFLSYVKCVCCFLLVFAGTVQTISAAPSSNQSAQQTKKKVVGNVKDENGEPLIGVTVAIKGQSAGTTTDVSGNYSLELTDPSVLVISYIGYKRQFIDYKGQSTINIKMESDVAKLDEVVVIGYGTQKVKNVTGAINAVDMQKMESLPVPNLTAALSGQVPGMSISSGSSRPGANDATITIRQTYDYSKDGGSPNPLIVIDDVIQTDPTTGLPSMDQFNRLDPSEVESITVLRDASAAIYGSRASQGAIVVKTKRGKDGAVKVSYSGKFEWNDAVSHEKTLSAYETGLYANSILRLGGKTATNLYSDSELEQMKSLNYNWLDKAWSAAGAMQHSINVSGGNNKATYFASASYYNQGANLGSQDYSRYNFRAGTDVKLTNNLKLSATVTANNSKQEKSYTKLASISDGSYGAIGGGEQADYALLLHMPKSVPWSTTINGQDYWVSPSLGPHAVTSTQVTANAIGAWNYFGLLSNGSKSTNDNFDYGANFSMQYDIPFVKGLSVKGTYALNRSSNNAEQMQLPYTLALATNTNAVDAHLYGSNTTWSVKENNKNSRVLYDKSTSKSEQMNFYVNYDRTFGEHNISAIASIERAESYNEFQRLYYESPLSGAYNGSSSSAGTLNSSFSYMSKSENARMSYLGRVSYSYAGKYLAQLIMRTDASTNFAPQHYWGFFPSLSLGWVLSEESWFKNDVKWVDYLKLRGSLGKTGKDNIKPWKWTQLYAYAADKGMGFGSSNGGTFVAGVTPNATPNVDVTWDTSVKGNIGLDFNFLKNRLSVNIDGYYDRNSNMLTSMSSASGVPISVGGAFAEQNYSTIDSWGTEISINWKDKIGDIKYSVGVNTSLYWNKVIKYPSSGTDYIANITTKEGYSTILPQYGLKIWKGNSGQDGVLRTQSDIDSYWNYLTEHAAAAGTTPSYLGLTDKSSIKTGMLAYQDLGGTLQADGTAGAANGQVKTNGEDYAKLNNRNISYGFTTNLGFSWKNFSWSAQIATSWGQYASLDNVKQNQGSVIIWSHESYWTDMFDPVTNPTGKYPNAYYSAQNNLTSDFWQVSSFRCYVKSMGVAYTVPKKVVAKIGIEGAKFSLSGNNLWDFYNPYPDHYRNMYDDSNAKYPTLRTWALGVNITF